MSREPIICLAFEILALWLEILGAPFSRVQLSPGPALQCGQRNRCTVSLVSLRYGCSSLIG